MQGKTPPMPSADERAAMLDRFQAEQGKRIAAARAARYKRGPLPTKTRLRIRTAHLDNAAAAALSDPETTPLRRIRLSRKPRLSMVELGELAGVAPRVIWNAEHNRPVSARSLARIARVLDVLPEDLAP